MSVTFIQRNAAKTSGGTVTVPFHSSAAASDQQMLAISIFSGNSTSAPSGTGWTLLTSRTNAYSKLLIYTRTIITGDLSSNVTFTSSDYTNAEMRTYRTTAGEFFVFDSAGDGLVAGTTTVSRWLIRCWASAQVNSFGGSSKTLTPPGGLLNAPASTSYNWYDGGLFGDDPVTSGSSGTSTATHSGGGETISPQWMNIRLDPPTIAPADLALTAVAPAVTRVRTQTLVPALLSLVAAPPQSPIFLPYATLTLTALPPARTGARIIPPADLALQTTAALPHRGVLLTNRWTFYDPELAETWVMPINPDSEANPLRPKGLAFGRSARAGGRYTTIRQTPRPLEWEFGGVIRTQAHHDTLDEWVGRRRIIHVTDHMARTYEVMLTGFEVTERAPTKNVRWRLRYSMKALLLRQLG